MGLQTAGESRIPRVLVVIDRLQDIGGAEGSTALVVDGLQGAGLEFGTLALVGYDLARHDELARRGVRFFPPPARGIVQEVGAVRAAIREFRPDLVHATLARAELVSMVGEGDQVRLSATGNLASAADGLAAQSWVREAKALDRSIDLVVEDARSELPAILTEVAASGVSVKSVEVTEPDLEAVFLHLTGRALRD